MNYETENPDPLAGCPGCGDEITRQEQYTTAVDHNGELFHSNDCVRLWDEEMNGVLAGDDVSLTIAHDDVTSTPGVPLAPTMQRLAEALAATL